MNRILFGDRPDSPSLGWLFPLGCNPRHPRDFRDLVLPGDLILLCDLVLPVPTLFLGLGCTRYTSSAVIDWAVQRTLRSHHLTFAQIAAVITIDHKATETGIVEFCRDRHLPLRFFTAAALRRVVVPHPSATTLAAVATPSVAEAAALLGCATWAGAMGGVPSVGLCVPKTIIQAVAETGALPAAAIRYVTVAIAQVQGQVQGESPASPLALPDLD